MRIGVVLPTSADWGRVVDLAVFAEDAGVDSVWVPDQIGDGALEAWTTMSALATCTKRVEIGAHMLNPCVRSPALLAHMAHALADVSADRLRVMLGTGWNRASYDALGYEFPTPSARVEQTRETLRALKDAGTANVDVAGVQPDVLELAAAEADGWALSANALDAYFGLVQTVRETCGARGRPFAELRVSGTIFCAVGDDEGAEDPAHSSCAPHLGLVGSIDQAVERAGDLLAHGMQELCVVLPDGARGRRCLERLVCEVRPQLG
jgi:alkanesulfonate monooxygenase SsuD/methylene tetrahydromethanopterin reductase-like flavin-dependent oxidoreductase (luciferase family)